MCNFSSNGHVFTKKSRLKYIDGNLGRKVKSIVWPKKRIYTHCLIGLNIPSENSDSGFNSFDKYLNFFQNNPI